ncbi:sensor histidine kinase [Kibdelosporangium lantanae]
MRGAIRRGWRATVVLADGTRTAFVALLFLAGLPLWIVSPLVLPEDVQPSRGLANMERDRLRRRLGRAVPRPYLVTTTRLQRWLDPAHWRDLGWLVAHAITGVIGGVAAIALWPGVVEYLLTPAFWWLFPADQPFTVLVWPITTWSAALTLPFALAAVYLAMLVWLIPPLARLQLRFGETLLRPTRKALLAERVEQLTTTRTAALESHGAELRRIERDLHDGVQAALVSVSVRVGLAARAVRAAPDQAESLLREAQAGIDESLGALRDVIRGIYPPILADRGLSGAVEALAGGQRVPVEVSIASELPRPPAPVEAAAYFVVAESLTNVSKHSSSSRVDVRISYDGPRLRVVVQDDGQGGADPDTGTGLLGIQRRVAALDGTTRIHSPANEGTTIEVLLPCEW